MPKGRDFKPPLVEEISEFSGINNRKNRQDLSINELYTGTNVDINLHKKLSTRSGHSMVISGDYHDGRGFNELGIVLAVRNSNLVMFNKTLTTETFLRSVGTTKMVYVYHSNKVFYTNSMVIGYIYNSASYNLATPTREYRANPLPGQCIEVHGFRLWVARGKELQFTDVGKFHSIDIRRNKRQMQSRVMMIRSVGKGMFISDESNIYYAEGTNPYKMPLTRVKPYPSVDGNAEIVDGQLIGEGMPGRVAMWTSTEGICVGVEGGQIINLTELNYKIPDCISSANLHRFENNKSQFIATMVGG